MCGINSVLNFPSQGEGAIKKMMEATRHRGPDHSSWLEAAPGMYLAGNRLKTRDLGTEGNQPITSRDGNAILVWNGAIYNHQELKNLLLERGVVFYSRSDAEVLVHWLKIFGQDGVKDLQGMFALVFLDLEKERIIIARDGYGKKPLYYFNHHGQWIFSSEARPIAFSGLVDTSINESQYQPYFYSRHTFPDETFFKGIKQWKAGQVMMLDFQGNPVSDFRLGTAQEPINLPKLGEFRNLVLEAVLKQMDADVPVGIILSGGADSSLLLHTWYRETGIPLHTFTAVFEKKYRVKYCDPGFASSLAAKYHSSHHEVLISPRIIFENWEAYIGSLDQPLGDSAGFLTWMLAREAKNYVKILISGAGADELFSGYDRHRAFLYYLKYPRLIKLLKQGLFLFPMMPRRIKKMLAAITDSKEQTYLNFSSLQPIPSQIKDKFLIYYPKELPPYKAALYFDQQYYLANDVLKIHDNANMAHGLEGRAPFIDEPLVNLSNNLSETLHRKLGQKYWIKEILKKEGLAEISKRKKLGFGLPLKEWLSADAEFRERIFAVIKNFERGSGRDFPEDMRKLAAQPEKHVKEGFLQIWNLFILASWKEIQGL